MNTYISERILINSCAFKKQVMQNLVTISPNIQSGAPMFAGTRVPVKNLFDYLKNGDSIDEFLHDFPSANRNQVLQLLALVERRFK
jgi:uncharacterized protein (DUF433 family)